MIRLFLTVLVVLTGFAAQASPAQARGLNGRDSEIGTVAVVANLQHQAVAVGAAHVHAAQRKVGIRRDVSLPEHVEAWLAAPVLPGIDRARE